MKVTGKKAWLQGFTNWSKVGLLVLLGMLLLAVTSASAAGNLLTNSSFEEGNEAGWKQDVWNHGESYTRFVMTNEVSHTGERSAYIENMRENDAKWVQTVKVKEQTLYRLSGYIRAEGVGEGAVGANLSVLGILETSQEVKDTAGEWQYVELYGRTSDKQKELQVAARLGGYGSINIGKAWFDELILEEVDSAPEGTRVVSFEAPETQSDGGGGQPVTTGTPFKLMGYALLFALVYFGAYVYVFRQNRLAKCSPKAIHTTVLVTLGVGLLVRLLMAPVIHGHTGDMISFKAWAMHAASVGLPFFYDTDMFVDYPPGYIYILYIIGLLREGLELAYDSAGFVILLKLPSMLADLGSAYLIYRLARKKLSEGWAFGLALLYVFNPAVLVNSTVWGQVDSFFTFFLLLTFMAISAGKLERGGILFALAVLVKPQALIFTPVLLFAYYKAGSWVRLGKSAAWGLGVFIAGILPYSFVLKPWWILQLYAETLKSYPYATLNAFNLFALTIGNWKDQKMSLLFFSYQTWGTLFIFVAVGLALYYFLKAKHNLEGLPYYIALILISTVFLFGAKMHERYWFPAVALVLAVFIYLKDRRVLGWFLGLTICHFMNVAYTLDFNLKGTNAIPDKDGVMLLFSFGSLVLYGYLLRIGYDGFIKGRLKPVDDEAEDRRIGREAMEDAAASMKQGNGHASAKLPLLTRLDWRLLGGLTLVYAVVAMYQLGSTKAPESLWEPAVTGESFYIDLGAVKQLERMNSFAEIGDGKYRLEFTRDLNEGWSSPEVVEVTYTKYFTWSVLRKEIEARYVKFTVESGGFTLNELAFYERDGEEPLPIAAIYADELSPSIRGSVEKLFDEPDQSHYHPTFLHGSYFDEIYHPRTAYEHIHNIKPYENTHPPLGKLIIAAGIKLFGMNPFGWRIMGTLFGIVMIPILYVFGKRLFGRSEYAFLAAFVFSFDFMHFAQTRIGTIDTYGVFFIMLMYYYMYRYISTSFNREPLRQTLVPLFLSGLFFGIGAASKWIVLYGGAGLAVLFFLSLYKRYREYEGAKRELRDNSKLAPGDKEALSLVVKGFGKKALLTVLWCIPFFVIIPGIIYSASFIPYMTVPGEGFSLKNLISYQTTMWDYHSKLVATHGFASPWWEWPFIIKPIWFYSGQSLLPEDQVSSIVSMGNPAVWWLGTLAVIVTIVLTWKRRDKGMLVVLTAFFSQYLPWMLVTRLTFIYHFFAMVPFLALCLAYVFRVLNEEYKISKSVNAVYMGIVLTLFGLFYPILSGMVVSKDYVRDVLRWFGTWYFFS